MQELTAAPRDHLTDDQVLGLLTGDSVTVVAGLELLDQQNRVVEDITEDLVAAGSTVSHDGRGVVHGMCKLGLKRELQWGVDRVRPYLTLSNAAVEARFNQGVYVVTTTPQTKRGETPSTFDVTGYDLLQLLLDGPGDTYVVLPAAGDDLMPNPGFEVDTSDYGSYEPFPVPDFTAATFERVTTRYQTGVASLEVTWPTTGAGISWINTTSERSFVVGKTYKFTARVWLPTGGPTSLFFDVLFTKQSPNFYPSPDGWVEVEWLWTATVPAAYVALSFRGTTAGQKTWIDEWHVTGQSTTCLDAVQTVIDLVGGGAPLRIDGTQQVAVLPGPMVWAIADGVSVSWLQIINDLLSAVGYIELYADVDGNFRTEPYINPADRGESWTFDTANRRTNIVGRDRTVDEDLWGKPNWWRFVRRGMSTKPVEGDGIYTVQNVEKGKSSQVSLRRVVKSPKSPYYLDAVDQAALVAQGDRIVAQETAATKTIRLDVGPFPIVGHLDVTRLIDAGSSDKMLVVSSETKLDGGLARWVLEAVA